MNAKSRFGYDHSAFRRAVDVLTVSGLSYVRPFLLLLVLFVFANLNVARFSGGGRFIADFKFIRTCVEGACHLFLLLLDSCVGRFRTVKWHFELVFVDWRALCGIKVRGRGALPGFSCVVVSIRISDFLAQGRCRSVLLYVESIEWSMLVVVDFELWCGGALDWGR